MKKNKVGRPKVKNKIVNKMISITLEDYNKIVAIADDEGRSIRGTVSMMIKKYDTDV